ncbi:thiol reductase thioredoxin [Actinomadura sp. KC06]|nr:thiol reductase thioredoxin [Actinomadura sp. KC06]
MTALTEADFDAELARAAEPLLVDFWEGCGPCKALVPVLEQIAAEPAGRLRVATVRLDDTPRAWPAASRSWPCVGSVLQGVVGLVSESDTTRKRDAAALQRVSCRVDAGRGESDGRCWVRLLRLKGSVDLDWVALG